MSVRAIRATALGGLVVAAAVLGFAAPAQAHNYLVSSTPTEGSSLTEPPAEFCETANIRGGALVHSAAMTRSARAGRWARSSSATRKASSSAWLALRRGSQ